MSKAHSPEFRHPVFECWDCGSRTRYGEIIRDRFRCLECQRQFLNRGRDAYLTSAPMRRDGRILDPARPRAKRVSSGAPRISSADLLQLMRGR